MVTQARFEYYKARKKFKEKEDFYILNEIAKMKGFKGGKVGERRIDPIEQYVESLVRELGFRGIKKGEKYIEDSEEKEASVDISPMEQYRSWLQKRIRKRKEVLLAEAKILDAEGRHREAQTKRDDAASIDMPKNIYSSIIPDEEYNNAMEVLRKRWIDGHEKFLEFCSELEKDVRSFFERTKNEESLLSVEDAFKALNEYHMTHPKSMNINTTDDLLIGLGYCLPEKGIGVTIRKAKVKTEERYKTFIVFQQL